MENKDLAQGHWWGFAAMPEQLEQPFNGEDNPMTLICQFHLGEGMVYVFADLDYFFGDYEVESGHIGVWDEHLYKVLYSPTRKGLKEHEIRYEDGESAVPKPIYENVPDGEHWYAPECFSEEVNQDFPGYMVLLDVEENDSIGLRFYDCGELFFLIKPEDLAARRFDKVICALYSY